MNDLCMDVFNMILYYIPLDHQLLICNYVCHKWRTLINSRKYSTLDDFNLNLESEYDIYYIECHPQFCYSPGLLAKVSIEDKPIYKQLYINNEWNWYGFLKLHMLIKRENIKALRKKHKKYMASPIYSKLEVIFLNMYVKLVVGRHPDAYFMHVMHGDVKSVKHTFENFDIELPFWYKYKYPELS